MRSTPAQVSGLAGGVTAITSNGSHTCAITAEGSAKCWGENHYGQLGDGTTEVDRYTPVPVTGLTSGVTAIAAGGAHTCAIVDGTAKCWGYGAGGQLGDDSGGYSRSEPVNVTGLATGVTAITSGAYHTCAVAAGGAAWCWGLNDGALGDGTNSAFNSTPVAVYGLTGGVTSLTAGGFHTCSIIDGAAECWGDNEYGQVGDATNTTRLTPTPVVGLTSGATAIVAGYDHTSAIVDGTAQMLGQQRVRTARQRDDQQFTRARQRPEALKQPTRTTSVAARDVFDLGLAGRDPRHHRRAARRRPARSGAPCPRLRSAWKLAPPPRTSPIHSSANSPLWISSRIWRISALRRRR